MNGSAYLGTLAALAAVLLVIFGFGRLAGNMRLPLRTGKTGQVAVTVRGGAAIDAKRRLVVVTWEGREGLILLGPHGDILLGWNDGSGAI